jgi:hypothetical protein
MRFTPGSVPHLQHLAGIAWKDGNIDEAERLEALARALDMVKSQDKPALARDYTRDDAHRHDSAAVTSSPAE